jgi:hypothetical protein
VTIQGIPKAAYNGFKLLNKMNGGVCRIAYGTKPAAGLGCRVTEEDGTFRILCWNNRFPQNPEQPVWHDTVAVHLPGNGGVQSSYTLITGRIRPGAGSPWETWIGMGKPGNLTPLQEEVLRAASVPAYKAETVTAKDSILQFDITVPPDEVLFAELRPRSGAFFPEEMSKEQKIWDTAMGDQGR